jgi:hypothetical protein
MVESLPTRLAIRGFKNGKLVFEQRLDMTDQTDIDALARSHVERLDAVPGPHMIEFEFLDEANTEQRFMRIGTDPTLMKKPLSIKTAGGVEAALEKLLEQYR